MKYASLVVNSRGAHKDGTFETIIQIPSKNNQYEEILLIAKHIGYSEDVLCLLAILSECGLNLISSIGETGLSEHYLSFENINREKLTAMLENLK